MQARVGWWKMDAKQLFADGSQKLEELLTWVVSVDASELARDVALLRAARVDATSEELSRAVFSHARWVATASGAVAGMPATALTMLPGAVADAAVLYRAQAKAAGRVALIHEPDFFDEPDAGWELLVPILGAATASEFLREAGVAIGQSVTRKLVRQNLSTHTLGALKRVVLKRLGLKLTQKMLFTKTVPLVGAAIGGAWNYAEVTMIRNQVIRYFGDREPGT